MIYYSAISYYNRAGKLPSPTRTPGVRQLLLTFFPWTPVCIKKVQGIYIPQTTYLQSESNDHTHIFYKELLELCHIIVFILLSYFFHSYHTAFSFSECTRDINLTLNNLQESYRHICCTFDQNKNQPYNFHLDIYSVLLKFHLHSHVCRWNVV